MTTKIADKSNHWAFFCSVLAFIGATPAAWAGPAPAPGPGPGKTTSTRISLLATGDIIFGRKYGRNLTSFGYNEPFRHVSRLISDNDISMGNLETPITAGRYHWIDGSILVFRALPKAADLLKKAGFNLIVTANNHSRDQKDKGLLETLTHLKRVSLRWVGTGRSLKEAWRPFIFEKNGLKVAVIAFTTVRNYTRRMYRGFFAYLKPSKVRYVLPWRIRALKRKVDLVVVSGHYGYEWKHETTHRERAWIRAMARAGCDLFLGHHPHVLRGIQRIGRMVAYYSLGNFMFDLGWEAVRESGMARVTFAKGARGAYLQRAEFIPVYIDDDRRPRPASGEVGRRIMRKMLGYSKTISSETKLVVSADRLSVALE